MFCVVLKYCFGATILQRLKTFYTIPLCRIASSNFLSEKFLNAKGVRQDDPLSLILFILYIESLANTLRDSPLFNGLEIDGLSVKVSMFADDTLVFKTKLKTSFNMPSIFLSIW